MKKTLLILSLIALSLAACAKKEEPTKEERAVITYQEALTESGTQQISVMAVNNTDGNLGYTTRLLCIDGVTYITYGQNITAHLSPLTGKPVACGTDEEMKELGDPVEIK